MKKILLSAAFAALCAGVGFAQSFEINYVVNDINAEFKTIKDGDVIEVPNVVEEPETFEYGGVTFFSQSMKAMLYVTVTNNTDTNWDANSKDSPVFAYTEVYKNDEMPSGVNALTNPSTCLGGGCWMTNPFYINLPAHTTSTKGTGEHIGFDYTAESEGVAELVKYNRTYDFTVTYGLEKLAFKVKYGNGGDASVAGIGADLNAPKEYYNLQGIKVANPEQGAIYIVKQGSKVSKQVIR